MIFDLDPDPGRDLGPMSSKGAAEVRQRMHGVWPGELPENHRRQGAAHRRADRSRTIGWPTPSRRLRALWRESMAHDNPDALRSATMRRRLKRKGRRCSSTICATIMTATAVAAYSVRARPGAPVAMPVEWDALSADLKPSAFDIRTVPALLVKRKRDPWADMLTLKQALPQQVLDALHIEP
jgi:bifunctional non-homologous end joining protein LigD